MLSLNRSVSRGHRYAFSLFIISFSLPHLSLSLSFFHCLRVAVFSPTKRSRHFRLEACSIQPNQHHICRLLFHKRSHGRSDAHTRINTRPVRVKVQSMKVG
ncbi:hypothetical protein B9Z19DRAFT_1095630 [Tuber borchii]|uniref:Uncharacterized protein n=1 Tax=Tuber borchii TaxID=42251 RepID=A0A2T6ZCG7_TUBBO|nr:hypothetical protein B9Z19DRAFT_1095630 [Tuber borchii]